MHRSVFFFLLFFSYFESGPDSFYFSSWELGFDTLHSTKKARKSRYAAGKGREGGVEGRAAAG